MGVLRPDPVEALRVRDQRGLRDRPHVRRRRLLRDRGGRRRHARRRGAVGRRARGGSGYYGAAEWGSDDADRHEPFHADVYAAGCVAYELLTGAVLFAGDSVKAVIDQHFAKQPAVATLARLERTRRFAPLAELLRAALARDPRRRPSAGRLRAGFAAIAPDVLSMRWPITH